jgi:hypothetical protein
MFRPFGCIAPKEGAIKPKGLNKIVNKTKGSKHDSQNRIRRTLVLILMT